MFDIQLKQTREEIQLLNKLDLTDAAHYTYNLIYNLKINFGNRSWGRNGTQEEQYYGILTQTVICDLFNQPRPNAKENFDNGIDLIINFKNIDVKTRSSKYDMQYMYVHNIMCSQLKYNTDYYLLCNFNKTLNKIQICGVLRKSDFELLKCFKHKAGEVLLNDVGKEIVVQQDIYCIPEYCCFDVWSVADVVNIINSDDIKLTAFLTDRVQKWLQIQQNNELKDLFKLESQKYSKNNIIKAS